MFKVTTLCLTSVLVVALPCTLSRSESAVCRAFTAHLSPFLSSVYILLLLCSNTSNITNSALLLCLASSSCMPGFARFSVATCLALLSVVTLYVALAACVALCLGLSNMCLTKACCLLVSGRSVRGSVTGFLLVVSVICGCHSSCVVELSTELSPLLFGVFTPVVLCVDCVDMVECVVLYCSHDDIHNIVIVHY